VLGDNAGVSARPSVVAASCVAAVALAEAATLALGWRLASSTDSLEWAAYSVGVTAIGGLILHRLPSHPVGWLLTIGGLVTALSTDLLGAYGVRAEHAGWPGAAAAQWLSTAAWSPGALMWVIVLLYTPTGRLPGRRWRICLYGGVLGTVLLLLGWLTGADSQNPNSTLANPFVLHGAPGQALVIVGGSVLAGSAVGAVASIFWRIRGADAVLRQQLKWVAVGGALNAALIPVGLLFWSTSPFVQALSPIVLMAAVAALGAAVLHYRLFEVDRIVLKAVAYAVAVALSVAVYAVAAISLGAVLGGTRPWQIAAATLVAAAAFRPTARASQRFIDRHFDKDREARVRLDRYLDGLRAGTERTERFEEVLRESTGIPDLTLLLHLPASDGYADVRGRLRTPDSVLPTVELRGGARSEAIVQYPGPADPRRAALIERLLHHARLAVQIARLGIELNRQVHELDASRRRISVAADAERRRIQRDLHDGAQQRLVTVGIALRSVEARLRRRTEIDDADVIDGLVADLQTTIAELRTLVADLPLPQLDAGIGAAFRELADRSPIPVRVEVDIGRWGAAVEATAYFVGSEGLTNTLKHAQASTAVLRAQRHNGSLLVSVSDDGVGGAALGVGSGLVGLRDRVTALGGRLQIESDGSGTVVAAELPCD
jgi:signal transduction histidine kinase